MGDFGRSGAGRAIWITGLSGAGKSTVAHLVHRALAAEGRPAIYLDGDVLREMLGAVAAHSPEERLALASTYGRICRALAAEGLWAVCATISMFHSVRRWNRANIPNYHEIYLKVPMAELKTRDPKGLYAKGDKMVGIDLALEEPEAPDLVIENYGAVDPAEAARRVLTHLRERAR